MAVEDYIAANDTSVPQHIIDILGELNRLDYGFAGLGQGLSEGDPEAALRNLYRGLANKQTFQWGDVLGIPKPDENAPWEEYLPQLVAHEAPQFMLSPWNLLAAPAKSAGIFPRIAKGLQPLTRVAEGQSLLGKAGELAHLPQAVEKFAGTPIYKIMMRRLPETNPVYKAINEGIDRIGYETNRGQYDEMLKAAHQAAGELPEGVTQAEWFNAMERGLQGRNQLRQHYEAARPLQDKMDELYNMRGDLMEELGAKRPSAIERTEEGRYMPHRLLESPDVGPFKQPGRTVSKWVGTESGRTIVGTKAQAGIKETPEGFFWRDKRWGEEPVEQTMADLDEMMQVAGEHKVFQQHPLVAMWTDLAMRNEQIRVLETMKLLQKHGQLVDTVGLSKAAKGIPQVVPEGWRGINVKNFDHFAAPKPVANLVENLFRGAYDPTTGAGSIADLVDRMVNSPFGRVFQKGTNFWRKMVLAHPGWLSGNIGSNPWQQVMEVAPWMLPTRTWQAARLGKTNPALNKELLSRGLEEMGMYGGGINREIEQILGEAAPGSRFVPESARKAGKFLEEWGINKIFKLGSKAEGNAKKAVALDWLAKNAPDLERMAPEQAQLMLDRAARVAHDTLGNYSRQAMSPFERNLAALPIPFLGWMSHVARSTGRNLVRQPQKLDRVSMALDAMFTPMSASDKATADPWIREQSPAMKFLGMPFPKTSTGVPSMMMLGRYLPWGNLEQFAKRPEDAVLSWVNPLIKAIPELLSNKSSFKGRDIDTLAGGFPNNLTNPLMSAIGLPRPYEMATNKMFGQSLPAGWDYLIGQSPFGRHIREADVLGEGLGLWTDPNREPRSWAEAFGYTFSGGKFTPFDRPRYERKRKWEAGKEESKIKSNLSYARKRGDWAEVDRNRRMLDDLRRRQAGMVEY